MNALVKKSSALSIFFNRAIRPFFYIALSYIVPYLGFNQNFNIMSIKELKNKVTILSAVNCQQIKGGAASENNASDNIIIEDMDAI